MVTQMPITFPDGRYTLGERVGAGAQGVVFRVSDRDHPERLLVAKVATKDAERQEGLRQEFALLMMTALPGFVKVRDLVDTHESIALIEDYAEGESIGTYLQSGDRSARLSAILTQALQALAGLHGRGFVHGDIKPAHLCVDSRGSLTLLDLGGAVLRAHRPKAYTPAYAAPEVLAGGVASARSDLFSLAKTLAFAISSQNTIQSLRRVAPWVAPHEHAVLEQCLAMHPIDRPLDASVCLALLGGRAPVHASPLLGRETEVQACLASTANVLYLVGPSGIGKSRLLREVFARWVAKGGHGQLLRAREALEVCAKRMQSTSESQEVIFLDDLEHAGEDFQMKLELFRVLKGTSVRFVVAAPHAPEGSACVVLAPLSREVLRALGPKVEPFLEFAQGNPGLLFGALGSEIPSAEALLARSATLSRDAQEALVWLALAGGTLPAEFLVHGSAELARAGFVCRQQDEVVLSAPHLSESLAAALGNGVYADSLTAVLLEHQGDNCRAALALANQAFPFEQRSRLLTHVVMQAHARTLRREEYEALGLLFRDEGERTLARLLRFERLSRELGRPVLAQTLAWLQERAVGSARVLVARRSLEARARAGDHDGAAAGLLRLSQEHPRDLLVQSTASVLALLRGDAQRASAALANIPLDYTLEDEEELARIAHNRGVVHIYQGNFADAATCMEASVLRKRKLGDVAGVRSSLLNLGIAYGKLKQFERAEMALNQSVALAHSLQNTAGVVWGLAAQAEFQVRSGQFDAAAKTVEAAERQGSVPELIAKDLALIECEVLIHRARHHEAELKCKPYLEPEHDGAVRARAHILLALCRCQSVPVLRTEVVRLLVQAARIARAAGDHEHQQRARSVLRSLRTNTRPRTQTMKQLLPLPIQELAKVKDPELVLLRYIAAQANAQRVYLCHLGVDAVVVACMGVDREGYAVPEALQRVPRDGFDAALRSGDATYQRALPMREGTGSLLTIAADEPHFDMRMRCVLVAEHCYVQGAFDALDAEWLRDVVALAQLIGQRVGQRMGQDVGPRMGTLQPSEPVERQVSEQVSHLSMAEGSHTLGPVGQRRAFPTIVGKSSVLEHVLTALDRAVDVALPVLLLGETGVGKELFARALHDHGPRAKAPFVALNCAAIADGVFEAELFGHRKGAFTGADRDRPGALGHAKGGTLFLDEVGELPLARQGALLRALESKTFRAVGSDREEPFDVRIVSATNRDLAAAARQGTFRSDLLFRLNVVELTIPPLRDRLEDVPALVDYFCQAHRLDLEFEREAMRALCMYVYPGNVRELAHLLERLSLLRTKIRLEHLPRAMRKGARSTAADHSAEDRERRETQRALKRADGNITHAAQALGLTRHGLKKRMLRLGLRGQA